ncbi:hypothetical protein ONZ51_g11728 [Trametes cubensis]|uniref:Uncharacterized protein n=1 Tax=Trametes cubensis TaxID=1111947 RepID=A0AAD7X631_9APHY|nr:hypothetical protein ONZ51_g11728 [Trametes cubensis]
MYLLTHTGGYIIAQGDDEANKRSRSSPTQMESSHSSALSSRVHRDRAHPTSVARSFSQDSLHVQVAQLPPSDRTSPTPADRETRDIPGPQPQHLPPVLTRVPCPAESNAAVRVSNHAFLSFTHSLTIFRALLHLRPRLFDVSRDPTLCRTSSALAAYNVSVRAHTHYAQNSPRFVCSTSAGRWVPQSTVHAQANVSALVFACPRRRVPSRTGSATPPEPPTNHTSPTPANRETRDIGRKLPARKGSSTPPASPAAAHPARATGCWPRSVVMIYPTEKRREMESLSLALGKLDRLLLRPRPRSSRVSPKNQLLDRRLRHCFSVSASVQEFAQGSSAGGWHSPAQLDGDNGRTERRFSLTTHQSVQPGIDLVKRVRLVRAAIFEAYTGIVTGFKDTPKVDLLLPHVPSTLASGRRTRSSSPFAFSATLRARPQRQFLSAEWLANELHGSVVVDSVQVFARRSKARFARDTAEGVWAAQLRRRRAVCSTEYNRADDSIDSPRYAPLSLDSGVHE